MVAAFCLEHPADEIENTNASANESSYEDCNPKSDEDFETAISFVRRRRQLVLRKVWRRSVHTESNVQIRDCKYSVTIASAICNS